MSSAQQQINKLTNVNRALYDELVEAQQVLRDIGEGLRDFRPPTRLPTQQDDLMRKAFAQAKQLEHVAEKYDEVDS